MPVMSISLEVLKMVICLDNTNCITSWFLFHIVSSFLVLDEIIMP